MKIKSLECPTSVRNYEKKYLESQRVGELVVCPIGPANQHIILTDFYKPKQFRKLLQKLVPTKVFVERPGF